MVDAQAVAFVNKEIYFLNAAAKESSST